MSDSKKINEYPPSYQDSSHFSSLPHSGSDRHDNGDKQRLHLYSKFSRNAVVTLNETENSTVVVEGGNRLERQLKKVKRRVYIKWTPAKKPTIRRRAMTRRRWSEALRNGSSLHTTQRQSPNRVDDTSKKPRTRQRRSPIRAKPSKALHNHHMHTRKLRANTQSSGGRNAKRSKTSRKSDRRAASESHRETRLLKRRQLEEDEEDTDFAYDEDMSLTDDEVASKDERDLEELVEKRQLDEVMISKAVLHEMTERILARVTDFILKNKGKDKQQSGLLSMDSGNATTFTTPTPIK